MNKRCITDGIILFVLILMVFSAGCSKQPVKANPSRAAGFPETTSAVGTAIVRTIRPAAEATVVIPTLILSDTLPDPTATDRIDTRRMEPINSGNISRLEAVATIHAPGSALWLTANRLGIKDGKKITIYSVPSFEVKGTAELPAENRTIFEIGYQPEYGDVFLINWLGNPVLWSIKTEKIVQTYSLENSHFEAATINSTSDLVAIAIVRLSDRSRVVEIRNYAGDVVQSLAGYKNDAPILAFSPDSQYLAALTTGRDSLLNAVYVWEISSGEIVYKLQPAIEMGPIQFSHSGDILAMSGGNTIYLWSTKDQNWLNREWRFDTISNSEYINSLSFSTNDELIVATTSNNQFLLVDVGSGELLEFSGQSEKITHMALSPDGVYLAVWYENGELILWGATMP